MNPVLAKLGTLGLVPVIKIDDAHKAVALAHAISEGGLPCAEITFRTEAAAEAISAIAKARPDMLVGAGTVINVEYAKRAVGSGAKFIMSPGFNPAVVDWCLSHEVPIIPGVNNASSIEIGLEKGASIYSSSFPPRPRAAPP